MPESATPGPPTPGRPSPEPTERSLLDDLAVEPLGDDVFRAGGGPTSARTFGGLLVGQALRAAAATVDADREAHAVHASFISGGTGGSPVEIRVERTRDGHSYATRRVVVEQTGRTVLVLSADFHVVEDGPEYQPDLGLPVPGPEGLPVGRYDTAWFESRDAPADLPGRPPHARAAWFRARLPLSDDRALHQHALAMLSDHGPTRAARQPHLDTVDTEQRFSVSLDHSIWFHRPARVDEWLCSELVPASTGGGRGLAIGTITTAAGVLVATVAQEATLRVGGAHSPGPGDSRRDVGR